jgi:hypothetical protein
VAHVQTVSGSFLKRSSSESCDVVPASLRALWLAAFIASLPTRASPRVPRSTRANAKLDCYRRGGGVFRGAIPEACIHQSQELGSKTSRVRIPYGHFRPRLVQPIWLS